MGLGGSAGAPSSARFSGDEFGVDDETVDPATPLLTWWCRTVAQRLGQLYPSGGGDELIYSIRLADVSRRADSLVVKLLTEMDYGDINVTLSDY
uniref:Uncharacterized protein n=1 Tax=Oryza glumipatula TaxID=40148 RepID=A0A0D9Y9J7_9ORYZ